MDIPLEILATSDYTAISLEGSLQVERGKIYKFCLVVSERTKLYIDNIQMIDMNKGSNNVMCEEKYIITDTIKISVDRFSFVDVNEPLVLLWQCPGKSRSIIPESAWVQDSNIFQAETAEFGGSYFESSTNGYSGPGYVSLEDSNSFIQWDGIFIESSKVYRMQFRYMMVSHHLNLGIEIDLFVDGLWRRTFNLKYEEGIFESWVDSDLAQLPLSAGYHSVRLQSRGKYDAKIDFIMIDEVTYNGVIPNYKRYNGILSCTIESTLTQSQCSSISVENEALTYDVNRSVASYDKQESFSTDALSINYENFYIRNVGTNMFMTVASDCMTVTLQPFDGSDAQRFVLKRGNRTVIQNKICAGNKVLQIPYNSSCSTSLPIMDFWQNGHHFFEYLGDGGIYNYFCGPGITLSAESDSIPGSKPILEPHNENNPIHQWDIELLDERVPCGCVFNKNDNSLFYNQNQNCIPSLVETYDYDLICNPPTTKCNIIQFITATDDINASSASSFEITGYGTLPPSCHDKLGATCEVTLCGINHFDIYVVGEDDDWKFTIMGDVDELLDHNGSPSDQIDPFPIWLGVSNFHSWQRYSVTHLTDFDVRMDIRTDGLTSYDIYSQLHWNIVDERTNLFIAGFPINYYSQQRIYSHDYYLSSDSCYIFEIRGYEEMQPPAGFNMTVDGIIQASTYLGTNEKGKSNLRFGSCSDTASPSFSPSLTPSTISPTFTTFDESSLTIKIAILTHASPSNISWTLIDTGSGDMILESPEYTQENAEYEHQECVPLGSCFIFTIYDSSSDGIFSSGGYKLFVNNEVVSDKHGYAFFEPEETLQFGNSCTESPITTPTTYTSLSPSKSSQTSKFPSASPSFDPSASAIPSQYPTERQSMSPSISSAPSSVQGILYPTGDTFIRSGSDSSKNHGKNKFITVKNSGTNGEELDDNRVGLLQFDVTKLKASDCQAFLNIYITTVDGRADMYILDSWNATIMRMKPSNLNEKTATFDTFDKEVDKIGPNFIIHKNKEDYWERIEISELIEPGLLLLMVEITSPAGHNLFGFASRESSKTLSPYIEILPIESPTSAPSKPTISLTPSIVPSIQPQGKISVSYYHISGWSSLPVDGFNSLSPYKREMIETIDFQPSFDETFAGSGSRYNVAAEFEGYLKFYPTNDCTQLCIRSDDGSKLYIDDELLINNDGLYFTMTKKCEPISLTGIHQIRIEYFQNGGDRGMVFEWDPPFSYGDGVESAVPFEAWVDESSVGQNSSSPSLSPSSSSQPTPVPNGKVKIKCFYMCGLWSYLPTTRFISWLETWNTCRYICWAERWFIRWVFTWRITWFIRWTNGWCICRSCRWRFARSYAR